MTRKRVFFLPSSDKLLGDKYQLLEQLGDGTHGWVWRAERLKDKQIIALKIPKNFTSADHDLKEGQELINAPRHENVIEIYWMGRIPPEKEWYGIEMEYFPSTSLAQLLEQRERNFSATYKQLFDIYEQVLAGIDHLSRLEKPLSHGDIKPHNILVGGDGLVKLTDFGSSALPEEIYVRTRENGGTILYSAPEYASVANRKGSFSELIKGDIYSLGVLLYQLVTARLPHDTPSQVVRYAPFPKPREVNSSVSPKLEAFILRCLEQSPDARWDSIAAMRVAFGSVRADQMNFQAACVLPPSPSKETDWSSKVVRLIEQENYTRAAEIARQEYTSTGDLHAFLLQLRALYRDERYFECIRAIENHSELLKSSHPYSADVRSITLNAYMITRKIDRAEEILEISLELDGASPQNLLKQASILGLKADYKGAVDVLLALNRQFPGKPAILRRLVLVYEQLRQPERAMAFLRAYEKVSPEDPWVARLIEQHEYLGIAQ